MNEAIARLLLLLAVLLAGGCRLIARAGGLRIASETPDRPRDDDAPPAPNVPSPPEPAPAGPEVLTVGFTCRLDRAAGALVVSRRGRVVRSIALEPGDRLLAAGDDHAVLLNARRAIAIGPRPENVARIPLGLRPGTFAVAGATAKGALALIVVDAEGAGGGDEVVRGAFVMVVDARAGKLRASALEGPDGAPLRTRPRVVARERDRVLLREATGRALVLPLDAIDRADGPIRLAAA